MEPALAYCCIVLLTIVGCSNAPNAASDEVRGFLGDVALDSCADQAQPVLVRCGGDVAPGSIAAVCGDLEAESRVTVAGGSLAVSGHSRIAAPLHVSSCFTGFAGIRADGSEDVAGDLSTAGDWLVGSPAHVGGNANVGGKLYARNDVAVHGVLHAKDVDMTNVTASTLAETIAARDPLRCELAPTPSATISRLEAGAFVDLRYALSAHSQQARVQLGCATYRFDSFGIDNELRLHIKGHTVIVVDGDVHIASPMRVELEPDARLDLLIGGSLEVDSQLSFSGGSTWLAVGGDVRITAPMQLEGMLSAPRSAVSLTDGSPDNVLNVTGTLLVGSLHVASPVTVTASAEPPLPVCRPSE